MNIREVAMVVGATAGVALGYFIYRKCPKQLIPNDL
jgi:hypothetical protein